MNLQTDEIKMKTNRTNIWELKVSLFENVSFKTLKRVTQFYKHDFQNQMKGGFSRNLIQLSLN